MGKAEKAILQSIVEVSEDEMELDSGEVQAFIIHDSKFDESVTPWRLVCLTCGLGGLQVVWSVILSNGSPYLVSLGLSKSLTALVWVAAPLCGAVVQPLVGAWSDHISTRWGRRRPFIFAGATGITLSMMLLAWASELVHSLVSPSTALSDSRDPDAIVISFAVLCIYALNIAIQPAQAGLRSLIVESLSVHQQTQASTYASVMQGLGNIFGYLFGFWLLPAMTSTSMTSFQRLSIFASLVLCVTIAVTCLTIQEKPASPTSAAGNNAQGPRAILKRVARIYSEMPRTIRRICQVQFLAWMGWFPFLYYSTTYVGEFYAGKLLFLEHLKSTAAATKDSSGIPGLESTISQEAIRYGTFASFLFAIVSFIYSAVFPRILDRVQTAEVLPKGPKPTRSGIVQAWKYSHVYFAVLMFSTFLVQTEAGATAVIALAGLSWALTLFAPFAIISMELAAQRALQLDDTASSHDSVSAKEVGTIIGLHNIAISLPQILAALVCSAIYTTTKTLHMADGTGWVLRAGGVAALGAAWLCRRLDD